MGNRSGSSCTRPRGLALAAWSLVGAACAFAPAAARGAVVVDDSFTDGGRDNGVDPLDTNWWTSSASDGIELNDGPPRTLGMVTGSAGRGIHTVFPTQTLANVGDKIVATYTFRTPSAVGSGATGGFRVGLFDTLGRAGLDNNIQASSGAPNSLYGYFATNTPALPGYMMDMDIGTGAEDLSFRQHDTVQTGSTPTGRLMGTTTGFTQISPTGPDGAYAFAPNTEYTGSLTITRTSATEVQLAGAMGSATHTATDAFDSTNFGMLAFWANSNVFGSSPTPGVANNGIDFSNVRIEFVPVPEPASLTLLAVGLALAVRRRR